MSVEINRKDPRKIKVNMNTPVIPVKAPRIRQATLEKMDVILTQIVEEINAQVEKSLVRSFRQDTDMRVIAHVRVNDYFVASSDLIESIIDIYSDSGWINITVDPTYTVTGTEYIITMFYG